MPVQLVYFVTGNVCPFAANGTYSLTFAHNFRSQLKWFGRERKRERWRPKGKRSIRWRRRPFNEMVCVCVCARWCCLAPIWITFSLQVHYTKKKGDGDDDDDYYDDVVVCPCKRRSHPRARSDKMSRGKRALSRRKSASVRVKLIVCMWVLCHCRTLQQSAGTR